MTHSRALVRVDGTAIRKKIREAYEKARRDLEKARGEFDRFHESDLPEFTRWLNTHFGSLLTELRELARQMAVDEVLIFQIEHEVMMGAGSHARAYQFVMEDRNNPDPSPPPPVEDDERDGSREAAGARPRSGDSDTVDDLLEGIFEHLFGESGPGDRPRGSSRARAQSASDERAARLKELYRALVRRLHPDGQREMTAQKAAWWHQAQEAYAAGDAEQLEVILALCEVGDAGTTAHTSLSLLHRITARLRSSLREIKRQLTERRRDPAWNFSRRGDRAVLAAQMRRTLTEDLERLRAECRDMQQTLARWKAEAARLKPQRRRKRARPDSDCPF